MKTSVLEFKLLDDVFCFNTKDVEYVFDLESYEEVQGFHKSVIGITKYNSDVMLLIDTAKLYSDKTLDLSEQKSVVVIKDEEHRHYGMLVDEITKLEEIESVKLSVDLSTDDMVVNHYKDKEEDEIVSEIHPLPLFQKYKIPAMATQVIQEEKKRKEISSKTEQSYLLFTVNDNSYAIASKYVKEVLEKDADFFELQESSSHIKGAMAVREEVIPIAEIEESQNSSDILVLEIAGEKLGIEVDEVYDIENFVLNKIEKIEKNESGVSAFYNHNGKVIAIVDPSIFINKESMTKEEKISKEENTKQVDKFDYLLFVIDGKKFSIDMSYVRQVIETDSLQKTQSSSIVASDNVEFITTWNRKAVNIIRLDHELNIECKQKESQSIFIECDGHMVAFMVHDIDNIVYINKEDITKSSSSDKALVDGAILHKNEVVVKLSEKYISTLG